VNSPQGKTRGRKLAPERELLLGELVEDGWPIRQITKTHGFNHSTIKRLHPDYVGMTQREGGKLSWAIKQANEKMRVSYAVVDQYY
jgi:hypothetical protein